MLQIFKNNLTALADVLAHNSLRRRKGKLLIMDIYESSVNEYVGAGFIVSDSDLMNKIPTFCKYYE